MKKLILIVLLGLTVLMVQPTYAKELSKQEKTVIYSNFIIKSAKMGLIKKVETEFYTVYVDNRYWQRFNIDQKRQFCVIVAGYFELKNDLATMADIKDYQTGKKLAGYSAWGFKVY